MRLSKLIRGLNIIIQEEYPEVCLDSGKQQYERLYRQRMNCSLLFKSLKNYEGPRKNSLECSGMEYDEHT